MIIVLRLGHRAGRDDRISTHVGLTARQWEADEIVYSGQHDSNMLESVRDVVERWGGDFEVKYREDWKNLFRSFEGFTVVLSMFGEELNKGLGVVENKLEQDLLVIVGGEKVPSWLYQDADLNLSVGNQPHSEVAALAVFLHEINERAIYQGFDDADIEVVPSPHGKEVKNLE
jgi:tRNA (cytidine56-2'-O)-methyltransferase